MEQLAQVVVNKIEKALFERLEYIQCDCKDILVLGAISEANLHFCQQTFPGARFTVGLENERQHLQDGLMNLPFSENQFDSIFSNLYLYQAADFLAFSKQLASFLKKDGILLFSSFGPGTPHQDYNFIDMHDIGDALLSAGFKDPVMDADRFEYHGEPLEIIYGHGWGGAPKRQQIEDDGSVKIMVDQLFST